MFGSAITHEIQPFKPFDEAKPFDYHRGEENRVPCSFKEVNRNPWEPPSFYTKIIRTWVLQLLWVYSLEHKDSIVGGRYTLQLFIAPFVVKNNNDLLIYNFRQTRELYCLPYNQYLADSANIGGKRGTENSYIGNWFNSLYQEFIEPELRTNQSITRIVKYYDLLRKLPAYKQEIGNLKITTTKEFTNEITKGIRDCISMSVARKDTKVNEENAANSKYFPMLNGFVSFEYQNGGKMTYHKDNYGIYMKGHTLIPYEKNYDYSCPMMKEATEAINAIFPNDPETIEEHDYALKIMATYLIQCRHDQFTINYGTGGEGKTVFGDMCSALLGSPSVGSTGYLTEGDEEIKFSTPCGLATTIEPEAIFHEKQMHGHDEGGVVELNGKRLCVIQEPPNKNGMETLKSANLKKIVGGASVSGSHKYGMNETFTANAHISIQTNTLYNIDDTTNGTARRTIVMPYHAHFINEGMIVSEAIRKHKFTKKADETICEKINNSIPFRQALFYMLVPYAEKLVQDRIAAMSQIVAPVSIKNLVQNYIKSSGGSLSLWLSSNIVSQPRGFISVKSIIDEIYNMGLRMRKVHAAGNPCDALGATSLWRAQIGNKLTTTFVGSIYKLKDEFIVENDQNRATVVEGINEQIAELAKSETFSQDEYRQVFETAAVNNLNMSRFPAGFDDLYILNYVCLVDFEQLDFI